MKNENQNLRRWLFALERREKQALQIVFDASLVPSMFVLAYYIRIETSDFLFNRDSYISVLIALGTVISVHSLRGFYNSFTRHISIDAAIGIAMSSAASAAALFSGILLLELQIPRSVPLIFALLLCVSSLGVRFFIRTLGHSMKMENMENVAIYGAGAAGIQLMHALQKSSRYRVCLFIDDNKEIDGKNLGGIPINNLDNAKYKFKSLSIQTLLLAIPSNIDVTRARVFEKLSDHPLKVKTIPNISSLISGGSSITDLKDIKVEDLLTRQPVQCDVDLMAKNITNKRVLVTGAGGSIGGELCRQIIKWKPKQLIMLDISEFSSYTLLEELRLHPASDDIEITPLIGSVQDRPFIKRVFNRFAIDTTYHAAAYKHVPLMEQNVMQCIANNVFGTLNLVEIAIASKVKSFILVSTDKAVRPTNFMGASKRLAEIICQTLPGNRSGPGSQSETCFAIVRFGNVLGSSGSVVPLFKKQIEHNGPITLTHPDIVRYFMTITEAAQLVIQAGSIAKGGEVFVLDMGKPVKIIDLAKKMVSLSGRRSIISNTNTAKDDEIVITISGLRPGEKLFEELSYSNNLEQTIHPRINKTAETPMQIDELKILLNRIEDALNNADYQSLHEAIASVSNGIVDTLSSNDSLIDQAHTEQGRLVPIPILGKQ